MRLNAAIQRKGAVLLGSVLFFIFMAQVAKANICSPLPPRYVNGCSTLIPKVVSVLTGQSHLIPLIYTYDSIFRSACDEHDRCYSRLGSVSVHCDDAFRANMKNRCDSAFPWWDPAGRSICKTGADAYYTGVRIYDSSSFRDSHGWGALQKEAATRSLLLSSRVNNDTCAVRPEATGIYDLRFTDLVRNNFIAASSRAPTLYEFYTAATAANPYYDYNDMNLMANRVRAYAATRANIVPLSLNYQHMPGYDSTILRVSPILTSSPGQNILYTWSINGVTHSNFTTISFNLPYVWIGTEIFPIRGYLRVEKRDAGWNLIDKNVVVVDEAVTVYGTCNPNPGNHEPGTIHCN